MMCKKSYQAASRRNSTTARFQARLCRSFRAQFCFGIRFPRALPEAITSRAFGAGIQVPKKSKARFSGRREITAATSRSFLLDADKIQIYVAVVTKILPITYRVQAHL